MGLLADRIQRIGESATLRISAKAAQLRAQGIDIIDLSIGEPDFPTPDNVKRAAKTAIDRDFTKYTANDGMPELKKAIAAKLERENKVHYEPDEIIVSSGAKNALYNLCVALFNKGDEAIIPAPYWVSYPEMVNLAKGVPVFVRCREENGFRLTPKDLAEAITPRTKALFLNNPCNPTGAAYDRAELEELVNIALSENILIIADEIYEKLVYDGFQFVSIPSLSAKAKELTVIINGVSKSYSMTGWRIGYAAGPKELIAGMNKVQSHSTSNACSISQMAAIEALNGPQMELQRMIYQFERRRNLGVSRLRSIPGISCHVPRGAFYLFPNCQSYFEKEYEGHPIRNSYGLAYYLLKRAHVAVVPGDSFGMEGYIRISYATSEEKLVEGIDRIAIALAELRPARREAKKALQNTPTKQREFVEVEANINEEIRQVLVAESEAFMTHDSYYEWNANIGGVVLQLRTNSPHLNDFWMENFYPAEQESEIEPHGIIYAVNWITGREPRAFYAPESHTAFFFKSAYYAQLRALALGMVADIYEKAYLQMLTQAACFDLDGRGTLLFFPPKSGRSFFVTGLLKHPRLKIIADDVVCVRLSTQAAWADCLERKFYLRTDWVRHLPSLKALFERSKCENVITNKEQCENNFCEIADDCDLDRGETHCFIASDRSRAMLDPYWIGGPSKHIKRTAISRIIIFTSDSAGNIWQNLDSDQALRILEEGKPPAKAVAERSRPFFNRYLLNSSLTRLETQKRFYRRLLEQCEVVQVNVAAASPEKVLEVVTQIVTGQSKAVLR